MSKESKDYLWLNISSLPYFRGLLRAVEARVYEDLVIPSPSLDLGCGDGHFSRIAFNRKVSVGLDPWAGPVRLAGRDGKYSHVIQGMGNFIPFADGYFSSAVSNSVLEHIPELDPVLQELSRVLNQVRHLFSASQTRISWRTFPSRIGWTRWDCINWRISIVPFSIKFPATTIAIHG